MKRAHHHHHVDYPSVSVRVRTCCTANDEQLVGADLFVMVLRLHSEQGFSMRLDETSTIEAGVGGGGGGGGGADVASTVTAAAAAM